MTGKKSVLIVIWLLCALLILGACGQEAPKAPESSAPEPTREVTPEPSPEPAAEPTAEPPAVPEMLSVCSGENRELCLAASADGTRFLICRNTYPEFSLWVQNADGTGRTDLFLTGITEEEAEQIIRLNVPMQRDKTKSAEEVMAEQLETVRKRYGSLVSGLVHTVWQQPRADAVSAAGNYWVLTDSAARVSARIDVRTGETVLLPMMTALAAPDGTVLCLNQEAYYRSTGEDAVLAARLLPDQTVLEKIDHFMAQPMFTSPEGCVLQEDGTLWMLVPGDLETVEQDGRSVMLRELSVVHCDSSGTILRRIDGGKFNMSFFPSRLQYSGKTGTGVVYSNQAYGGILWAFSPEDETLKPLAVESLLPPALRYAEREDALDSLGSPKEDARSFLVFGLSRGGTKLLVQDMKSAYLLSLDLRTLKADILLSDFQITSLLSVNPNFRGGLLFNMGWNGGEILSCGGAAAGYAIRLPFRDAD